MLAVLSLSALAATTVKSSKSNTSDREQATATGVVEEPAPATAADKTTVNGSKNTRYRSVLSQQGRVTSESTDPTDAHGLSQQGHQPDARMEAQQGQLGQPGPVESIQLNSSRANVRLQAGPTGPKPNPGPVESTTVNTSKSNTFRVRGTPESSPPKPTAAGAPSGEPAESSNLNSGRTNTFRSAAGVDSKPTSVTLRGKPTKEQKTAAPAPEPAVVPGKPTKDQKPRFSFGND
jgi:hypothetical protein